MRFLDVERVMTDTTVLIKKYQNYLDFYEGMERKITFVVDMEGSISGEGADGLVANHRELQLPVIQAIRAHLHRFIEKLETFQRYVLEFESNEKGLVSYDFWANLVPYNIDKYEQWMETSEKNIQALVARASGMVNLGKFDLTNVYNQAETSKKHAESVAEGLNKLDAEGFELFQEIVAGRAELEAIIKQAVEWSGAGPFLKGVNLNDVRNHFSEYELHKEAPKVSWSDDTLLNLTSSSDPDTRRMVSVLYNLAAMGVNPAVVAALAKELDAHVGRPVSQGIIQTAVTNGVYQPSPGAEMHAAFPIDFMYNGGPRSVMEAQVPEWYYIGEAMPLTAQSMYLRQIREAMKLKDNGVDLSNASSAYEASHMVNQPKEQTKYHSDDWGKSTSQFEWSWSLDDTSMAADFTPGVSNLKSGVEAFTGYDPITGRKLEPWERGLALAGIVVPAVKGVKAVSKGAKNADKVADVSKASGHVKYGDHYTRVGRKKALKPNVEYVNKVGHQYKTDTRGRIAEVNADLSLGTAKRNQYAQRNVGGKDRLPNDDGGHLIASIFKGSGDLDNLVPMNANVNRGAYKKLENDWKRSLDKVPPDKVQVKIKPVYKGDSQRPVRFIVKHKAGDRPWKTDILPNN
ncbi:DNA/RNA non-specific endonuclease [Bacillus sp. FSL W7-1360]